MSRLLLGRLRTIFGLLCRQKSIEGDPLVVLRFLTWLTLSDKDKLEFDVVVTGTSKFTGQLNICPSTKPPPREFGEFQAWISVNDELLPKPLDILKRMIVSNIHYRPVITTVRILTRYSNMVGGACQYNRWCALAKRMRSSYMVINR